MILLIAGGMLAFLWRLFKVPERDPTDPGRLLNGGSGKPWALLFIPVGLLFVTTVAVVTPPFQVSDEIAHFSRADQVGRGKIVGMRQANTSGGLIDHALLGLTSPFYPLILHPENKVTKAAMAQAEAAEWDGQLAFATFENTSIYPPFFYGIAGLGIAAGKLLHLPVLSTFYLARLMNGIVAAAFGVAALRLAGPAAPWLFGLLLLPMTVSQMGSASQDALALPVAAVAAALTMRIASAKAPPKSDYVLLCIALSLIAMGRVAYWPLALVPLSLRHVAWRARLIGAIAVVLSVAVWSRIAATFALVQFGLAGADSHAQIHLILHEPLRVFALALNTFRFQYDLYALSFVGKLGWLDTPLPDQYEVAAWLVLGVSLALLAANLSEGGWRRLDPLRIVAVVGSIACVFAALYVTWTPVGNFIVDGVQGRYFTPLAMFVPCFFARSADLAPAPSSPLRARLRAAAVLVVAAFPLASLPVTAATLIGRYYMG